MAVPRFKAKGLANMSPQKNVRDRADTLDL